MRSAIAIIMILISVVGFITVISPKYTTIQEMSTERAELDEALGNARRLQAERESLLAEFRAFEAGDLADLEILLPDNIDNVKLILELDSLASQLGLSLRDVDVADEEDADQDVLVQENLPYGTVDIEFTLSGDYNRFVAFVESIERSLRLIDVLEISFQAPTNQDETYQYNVTIRAYWLK